MMPVLQAEEAMSEAERYLVGRCLKPEHSEAVAELWARMHSGLERKRHRRKAPPIPREYLPVLGIHLEELS